MKITSNEYYTTINHIAKVEHSVLNFEQLILVKKWSAPIIKRISSFNLISIPNSSDYAQQKLESISISLTNREISSLIDSFLKNV